MPPCWATAGTKRELSPKAHARLAHGKSAAQVSLRYLVQLGCVPIPRTATPAHMKENMEVFDFKLSDAEMAELKKLNATNMRVVNPPHAPVWDAA